MLGSLSGSLGILATTHLKADERALYNATDLARLDGHEDHICCSIEYPNAWYFDRAKDREPLFRDWVVLLIEPRYLWEDGTRFCPRNAANAFGRDVGEGIDAFRALFAISVSGAYGKRYNRDPAHLPFCPTDEQAEILIPDRVPIQDLVGVVVSNESQAKNEITRLRLSGVPTSGLNFLVNPTLYEKRTLSTCIRSGTRPVEVPWDQGIAHG